MGGLADQALDRIADALEDINSKLPDISTPEKLAAYIREADRLIENPDESEG